MKIELPNESLMDISVMEKSRPKISRVRGGIEEIGGDRGKTTNNANRMEGSQCYKAEMETSFN